MNARRDEAGFTLVELLVAIAILGIVMVPLSGAFVLALRTTETANSRIANANDAEILTIAFPPDVHAAGSEAADVAVGSAAGTTCSGITNVVTLQGDGRETTAGSTSTWTSAYAIQATGPSTWRLIRAYCEDGAAPETMTVARNLASASAARATVSGRRVTLTIQGAGTSEFPTGATTAVSATRRAT